jgi:hypothetical protein
MSVITDLDGSWQEKKQREDAFEVRAALENASNVLLEVTSRIQEIVDSGNFNTIPTDLKNALNRWWTIFKDAQADAQADAEIVQIYQWRP